jgi:hypothetical protein
VKSSRAEQYRQLAQECLDVARTLPAGARRMTLLQMAQVWQRLAGEQYLGNVTAPSPATEQIQPISQQQQQVQPKDDDKKD